MDDARYTGDGCSSGFTVKISKKVSAYICVLIIRECEEIRRMYIIANLRMNQGLSRVAVAKLK